MFPLSLGFTALVTTHFLVYTIKCRSLGTDVAIVLLMVIIGTNILATIMPSLFSELWGFRVKKVIAYSMIFWFSIACGIIIGLAT